MIRIGLTKGEELAAVLIEDEKVTAVIEESKLDPSQKKTPSAAINLLHNVCQDKDMEIVHLEETLQELKGWLPHLYYGLSYTNSYVHSVVVNQGLFYKEYDLKYTIPKMFFEEAAKLIKAGKRVGWFQGKWSIGEYDLNRCVITNEVDAYAELDMAHNELFRRLIEAYGSKKYFPDSLGAQNPKQAITKLKNKEIDVLVINNMIVVNKEEDLKCR